MSDSSLMFPLPRGCGVDEVIPLLPRPRAARDDTRLSGTYVAVDWNGSAQDREEARAEIDGALAESGFEGAGVKFLDEFQA